jgi:hypothetical protein
LKSAGGRADVDELLADRDHLVIPRQRFVSSAGRQEQIGDETLALRQRSLEVGLGRTGIGH